MGQVLRFRAQGIGKTQTLYWPAAQSGSGCFQPAYYLTVTPLHSNRNPLHNIPRDLALPAVVEAGGARVGVAGEALDLFERDALFEQVGDDGDAEGVRRKALGQPSVNQAPLHHAADVVHMDGCGRELPFLAIRRETAGSPWAPAAGLRRRDKRRSSAAGRGGPGFRATCRPSLQSAASIDGRRRRRSRRGAMETAPAREDV